MVQGHRHGEFETGLGYVRLSIQGKEGKGKEKGEKREAKSDRGSETHFCAAILWTLCGPSTCE